MRNSSIKLTDTSPEAIAALLIGLRGSTFTDAYAMLSSLLVPPKRGRKPKPVTEPSNSLAGAVKAVADAPVRRRPGRPPGSKNRKSL